MMGTSRNIGRGSRTRGGRICARGRPNGQISVRTGAYLSLFPAVVLIACSARSLQILSCASSLSTTRRFSPRSLCASKGPSCPSSRNVVGLPLRLPRWPSTGLTTACGGRPTSSLSISREFGACDGVWILLGTDFRTFAMQLRGHPFVAGAFWRSFFVAGVYTDRGTRFRRLPAPNRNQSTLRPSFSARSSPNCSSASVKLVLLCESPIPCDADLLMCR